MQASQPADEDRLPWLEPYRESGKPGSPLSRRGVSRPVAVGAAMGLAFAAAAGGYWLGQRDSAGEPQPSATVALPTPRPEPVQVAESSLPAAEPDSTKPEAPQVQKVDDQPAPAKPDAAKPAPVKKAARPKRPERKKVRSAGTQQSRLNSVRAAQERQARSRPWPKMPSPGPAGQVIQLGAFSTPTRANNAYYQRIARYPVLTTMPKVVVPVVTKPDGRILYVLRLGTTSRQQSKTVCRNLRASGDHCLVIG